MRGAAILAFAATVTSGACGARASISGPDAPGNAAVDATTEAIDDGPAAASDATGETAHASGCGRPLPSNQVPTQPGKPIGYTQFTVMATGANLTDSPIAAKAGPRTFWVRVPADYDPNRRYRVVYIGQGCGGFNAANSNAFQLFNETLGGTEQAI